MDAFAPFIQFLKCYNNYSNLVYKRFLKEVLIMAEIDKKVNDTMQEFIDFIDLRY